MRFNGIHSKIPNIWCNLTGLASTQQSDEGKKVQSDCQKEDDQIAWFSVPCSKFVHYVYIYIMYIMHICILSIILKGDSQHQSHAARAFLPRLVEPAPWGGAG